jgi:hypothetical protein
LASNKRHGNTAMAMSTGELHNVRQTTSYLTGETGGGGGGNLYGFAHGGADRVKRRVVQKAIKAHGNIVICAWAEGARNAASHMLPDAA